ncbi:MAG: DNA cytosine methyltransferase [Lachnospiraceae bacterium]|nr:DNA cytosine methyltransferase [Lachnospiraceae bacterium]
MTADFSQIKKDCGKLDVVIGGPPCQGFSNANRTRRQLINGSNELVKRYVKAIEEIRPRIFVMENVKTIASDTHSFCLTYGDKDYIVNKLGIQTHDKEIVLYEGSSVEEVYTLSDEYLENLDKLVFLTEEELYFVYNIYKKRKQLDRLFSKQCNEKVLEGIIEKLVKRENLPDWFNNNISEARKILESILKKHVATTLEMSGLMEFWNIHRYFQGLVELANKDAIFEHELENHSIKVRLHTYIVIDYVHKALTKLGYKIKGEVLNAAKYGVPQTRERYVLIGVYSPKEDVEIPMPSPIIDDPRKYITVREAIKDLEAIEPTTGTMDEIQRRINLPTINSYYRKLVMKDGYRAINNHVCTATRELSLERFEQIEPGKNFHSLPDELKLQYENPSRTQNTVYRRLDPNLPSETVVNVRKSMWIHPKYNRAISAREAARLQSFPDDYIFYGTKDSVYQQIGNAVPPVLGRAVAEVVLELLGTDKKDYVTLLKY